MGCTNSKQRTVLEEPQPQQEQELSKSFSTRARRLSLETKVPPALALAADGVVTIAAAAVERAQGGSKLGTPCGPRLSYVTNDAELADHIRATYGEHVAEGSLSQPPAAAGAQQPPASQQAAAAQGKAQPCIAVEVACLSRAGAEPGAEKVNQDSLVAFEEFISPAGALFGAMDGHGPRGHHVSAYLKQHLPLLLARQLTAGGAAAPEALRAVFLAADAGLTRAVDCEFSGSTCSLALLQGCTLTAAWVGDSRIVLGRCKQGSSNSSGGSGNKWQVVELSVDHKPCLPEERSRIVRSGGRVERLVDELGEPVGPYRVWLACAWVPGLAMSRALGDELAHTVGVTSEPQHVQLELTPADQLLLLASDGVWEFIASDEALALVAAHASAEDGCRALVDEARRRWLNEEDGVVDDITAVVVRLHHRQQGQQGPGSSGNAVQQTE